MFAEIDGPPTDEVDGVHEETKGADKSNDGASQDHMIQSMGEDEVDFHDENPPVPSLSFDTVHSEVLIVFIIILYLLCYLETKLAIHICILHVLNLLMHYICYV